MHPCFIQVLASDVNMIVTGSGFTGINSFTSILVVERSMDKQMLQGPTLVPSLSAQIKAGRRLAQ